MGKLRTIKNLHTLPKKSMFAGVEKVWEFKYLMLVNLFISSIYTVGILSAYYAAISAPSSRLAVAGFSGSINGIASLALILFFDPQVALITDEAYKGEREYLDLKIVVLILIFSRLLGTLLGQVIFAPVSKWILFIFHFLT